MFFGFQFFNLFQHPKFDLLDNFIGSGYQFFGVISGLNGPSNSFMGSNVGGEITRRLVQVKAQVPF
jgi:hypothetical protein